MANLDGVPADVVERVAGYEAARVTRGGIQGMGPDAVAADVVEGAAGNGEIGSGFFQQDAAGGVVSAGGIAGTAVVNGDTLDGDVVRMIDEDGEPGDFAEVDAGDGQAPTFSARMPLFGVNWAKGWS